jgi:(2Fe-2S) ferredoxin
MAIKDLTLIKKHLFLCNGGTCKLNGAEESTAAIRQAISDAGLSDQVHTTKTLCNGRCKDGPIVISQPDGNWFKKVFKENARDFANAILFNEIMPEQYRLYVYGDHIIHSDEVTRESSVS